MRFRIRLFRRAFFILFDFISLIKQMNTESFEQLVITRLDTHQSPSELFFRNFSTNVFFTILGGFGFPHFPTQAALSPLLSQIPLCSSLCRITVPSAIGSVFSLTGKDHMNFIFNVFLSPFGLRKLHFSIWIGIDILWISRWQMSSGFLLAVANCKPNKSSITSSVIWRDFEEVFTMWDYCGCFEDLPEGRLLAEIVQKPFATVTYDGIISCSSDSHNLRGWCMLPVTIQCSIELLLW